MIQKLLAVAALWIVTTAATAQIRKDPTNWSAKGPAAIAKVGQIVEVRISATIAPDWHIYSNDLDPNIGPLPASFTFSKSADYELVGKPVPVGVEEKFEEVWNAKIRQFVGKALFVQKVKILKTSAIVRGTVEYMACSDKDGTCLPPATADFSTSIKALATTLPATTVVTPATALAATETTAQTVVTTTTPTVADAQTATAAVENPATNAPEKAVVSATSGPDLTAEKPADTSWWGFIVASFLAGLVALLTPCVFPIIPMTVSFFTGQRGGWWKALLYGFSIVAIYVLIGVVVSRFNGPAFANFVSTHWLPNILFFLIFFVFGLSFLGLFEITLPNSFINSADQQAEKGGIWGIFFMAFTLVLVSFSCTGPLVGSLLVASAGGEVLKPVVGMAAFSSAFAIPFTLFAAFPQWLKKLPKSGGWLNSVKVVLGFIELALALKFLSIADQVYHWHILNRDVFLSLWIVIFGMLGFYFLGKIRLPHDSKTESVAIPRLLMSIVTLAFVVYMIPGLWGAPLDALAGYLPPETSQSFNLQSQNGQRSKVESQRPVVRHGDLFKLPHGLDGFFDFKEALAYAKTVNKPVFIDFTGHGCVNCREMEARVWRDPAVLQRLQNDYVILALYVDDKTELPETEWYTSTYDQKQKTSIGAQNADLQIVKYNNNAQPHYCLVDDAGNLLVTPKNYDLNVAHFTEFLDAGKAKFAAKK
jgi:thiol:disulfide interchange protein